MASKSALKETLDELSKENFAKFCHQLLDRKTQPKVRRSRVEDKSRWEVVDVMVSTFTEDAAVQVAAEILDQIGCTDEAKDLAECNKEADEPKPGTCDTEYNKEADGPKPDVHFVDKHKVQLIKRVTNIKAILDELLGENVIQQGVYDHIKAVPTSQEKMRQLYSGPLKAGVECKDIFYRILETNEPSLIKDLEINN